MTEDDNNNGMIATDVLAPTRIIAGKYHLGKIIGEGGMGAVYEADHHDLGTSVAVKLLNESSSNNPKSLARFRREAKVMGQIKHENVVAVMDAGTDEMGTPFLVMEKLEGESLSATLRREIRLSEGLSAWIISEILAGLGAAHAKKIIHRDLKPGNVFIATQSDGSRRVKLLDFGISKLGDASPTLNVTAAGALIGTPNFMAPEQIRAKEDLDGRVDVYAAGIMLYRLVTGKLPFLGSTPEQLYRNILQAKPTPPRELRPELSPELESIIYEAIHPDRDKRFQSAFDFQVALQDAVPTESYTPRRQLSNVRPKSLGPKAQKTSISSIRAKKNHARTDQPETPKSPTSIPMASKFETSAQVKPWGWMAMVIIVLCAVVGGVLAYLITKGNASADRSAKSATNNSLLLSGQSPLYFAFARHKEPEQMKKELAPLVAYLSAAIDRPVEIKILDNYESFTPYLSEGNVHLAAMSAFNYVKTKKEIKGLQLLATPTSDKGASYGAYILTNAKSDIRSMSDLKGKTICYPSKTSSSGYIYPRAVFRQSGIRPDKDLTPRFTTDHFASLRALLGGGCDVASVYDKAFLESEDPSAFTVLQSTKRIPWDAYCASPNLDAAITEKIRQALTHLKLGSKLADQTLGDTGLNFTGFLPSDDSLYDSVRNLRK